MVSTKDMQFLLKTAEKHHAKVLLIGDTQQLKAVEAGKPFAQLQANGMETAGMSEIQRQRNPELKKSVELAAKGEIEKSVSLLQKSIFEIKNPEVRYGQLAKDYLALSEKERKETLIVCGTNDARKAINQRVREGLGLGGKGFEVEVLERKDLTKAQTKELGNYQVGDIVRPEKDYPSLELKKGDLCQVSSMKKSYFLLQRPDGSLTKWKPNKKNEVSVFQKEKTELYPGEMVRITQNERKKGLSNGDRAKVIGLDQNNKIHFRRDDGKVFQLDGSKPLHLEYGYCSTVHAAQGRTCKNILIEADTKSLTSSRESYYVAISRARSEAKIYTNDKGKLPKAMSRINEKEAALEIHERKPQALRVDRQQLEI
jgi:ATP-dependent exoDNAse (exonuclease V) alpha subunit